MREPRVFTIPAGTPFLPTLAEALLDGTLTDGWPVGTTLADATIYLPTRRAGRAFAARLAERAGRRALLLPRIVPLGDVDEDLFEPAGGVVPPIPTGERRLILARLIQGWAKAEPRVGLSSDSAADAVGLASDLAALMDSLATEGVDWDELAGAVATDHSEYYANTLSFVRIAYEAWPKILAGRGASDPARRRHEALLAEAERLTREPPRGPIVAAGSTGSIPATARLLSVIARLPHGALVLPGLDTELDEPAWLSIGGRTGTENPEAGPLWTHPQCMMRRFLADPLGIERSAVRILGPDLPTTHPVAARRRMASEIMRPAETTDVWSRSPMERTIAAEAGCDGLALIEAADEREEALAIAIALRETLEEAGRTAALVTPDRALARRVAVELRRWGIEAEDSAGSSLAETPAGRLARLAAEAAASGFKPLPLLALLAHPAVCLGRSRAEIEKAAAALEIGVLRGPAPGAGLEGIAAALELRRGRCGHRDPVPRRNLSEKDWRSASDLLDQLVEAFEGFGDRADGGAENLLALTALHARTLLALVDGAEGETSERSWSEVLGLLEELAAMPEMAGIRGRFGDYPAFLTTLLRERVLAPDLRGGHRRVKILGLLEARLLEVDRIVLGALGESIWPPTAENDAFLNRPLRLKLGLSPAERRIGQTAHDFVQALGTPDAILTHARKRDGKPTVPSRFLERLRAFVGPSAWTRLGERGSRYLHLAEVLDTPRPAAPFRRPSPQPGSERFPRNLSVTEIETLVRDPYAIFARHILRLSPLEPIGALPTASERGTILHDVLAAFAAAHPDELPPLARHALLQLGSNAFGPLKDAYPELHALWWPDFQRIAPHVLSWEADRRAAFGRRFLERDGTLSVPLAEGDVLTVRARADRIELDDQGGAAIIDFKSGQVPTDRVVAAGFSPQLTLEAAMLMAGGFREVPAATAAPGLHYVKLGGRARLVAREVQGTRGGDTVAAMIDAHLKGLTALACRFGVEGVGYVSRPYPQYASRFAPYDHLARVAEWSVQEEDEAGP